MQQDTTQHMTRGHEIFVLDDDEIMRDTLSAVFVPEGFQVTCFAEGRSFLAAARMRAPACILLDINMPDRSGFELLRELNAPNYPAPILMVSGQNDVPTAVKSIRGGALDFIEKPFVAAQVVARVCAAITAWTHHAGGGLVFPGYERLTAREREVLSEITAGASTQEAARKLGISPRTVEVHRARIMDKLGAKNAADLVRLVLRSGWH